MIPNGIFTDCLDNAMILESQFLYVYYVLMKSKSLYTVYIFWRIVHKIWFLHFLTHT